MRPANHSFSNHPRPRGFTLTELLIAVAMVLILMAGIVKVFSYATNSIGAGMAVSDIIRAQRVLDTLLPADATGLSTDPTKCPAILLDSQQNDPSIPPTTSGNAVGITNNGDFGVIQGPIFLNKADQANSAALSTSQVQFRQDSFSFFSRGNFTRQTGNDGTFVNPITSTWAWIWYGQLWLPDNSATFHPNSAADTVTTYPGGGTASNNPNNFYAAQGLLGREAMLILPKNTTSGTPPVLYTDIVPSNWAGSGGGKNYQSFINEFAPASATAPVLTPLAFDSQSRDWKDSYSSTGQGSSTLSGTGGYAVQQSRYDLAGVTAINTGDPFQDYFNAPLNWGTGAAPSALYDTNWFAPVLPANSGPGTATYCKSLNYRFQANPYPVRPLAGPDSGLGTGNGGSAKASGTVPILATGCARFYVEYAGDFINQNPNGTVNTLGATGNGTWNIAMATPAAPYTPDGTDFYIDQNNIRHIRWYGLPRDADGDGIISTTGVASGTPQTGDVLPLAYYLNPTTFATSLVTVASFEKLVEPSSTTPFNHYICAWDATLKGTTNYCQRPTMFRITIELADPAGRLGNTRVLQYIVPVQQQ